MQASPPLQGGKFDIGSEYSVVSRDFEFVDQILALHLIVRVLLKFDAQIEIASLSPALSLGALPSQPDALPLTNSTGDLHRIGLDFARVAATERDLPG